jgi:hypothetical protein
VSLNTEFIIGTECKLFSSHSPNVTSATDRLYNIPTAVAPTLCLLHSGFMTLRFRLDALYHIPVFLCVNILLALCSFVTTRFTPYIL